MLISSAQTDLIHAGFVVKGLLVMDSTSVLCSFHLLLVPKFPSSLFYVTFLTAELAHEILYTQSVISSFSSLSFGCTSSDFKVFTGLIATGT